MSIDQHISPWLSKMLARGEFKSLAESYPIPSMTLLPVSELRHLNFLGLIYHLGSIQKLATALGKSHSQLSQLRNQIVHSTTGRPRVIGDALAREIEVTMKLPSGWMDHGHLSEALQIWRMTERGDDNLVPPSTAELIGGFMVPKALKQTAISAIEVQFSEQAMSNPPPSSRGSIAHPMSEQSFETVPSLSWEQLMSEDPKGTFYAEIPDDAMAPRVRAGNECFFRTGITPRPGAGVLVKDADGAVHFREYREAAGGAWEAHAANPAYRTLHSQADGLRVIAVLRGVMRGWEEL